VEPACFEPANIPPQLQPLRADIQRLKARLF
jgi:hypothetical protein